MLQRGTEELLDLPVKHPLRIRGLVLRTQVLDHPIRLQHVRTDLIAPTSLDVFPANSQALLLALLLRQHQQSSLQHPHRRFPITSQRSLVLATDDKSGRQMSQPHRGGVLLDILAAVTRGAIDIDLDVIIVDLHLSRSLRLRHDLDSRERRVPCVILIERRNPYESVYAML